MTVNPELAERGIATLDAIIAQLITYGRLDWPSPALRA